MEESKFIKAYCRRTGKHYGLEARKYGSVWKVVNMDELSEEDAALVATELRETNLVTNENLLPCSVCDSRVVSGCSCIKNRMACSADMPYNFDCIYCSEMTVDYSLPVFEDIADRDVETVTIQGKEIKVVTFSNVEWKKFDKIARHIPGRPKYPEPEEHVIATREDIEFHGYNISPMSEGVYYTIGRRDDFEIECTIDTSKIKPHPGGFLYITIAPLSAEIKKAGGTFSFNGSAVAKVRSAKFKMTLSVKDGGKYEVFINDSKKVSETFPTQEVLSISFGFSHPAHNCDKLSHAYIRGIKMNHGVAR